MSVVVFHLAAAPGVGAVVGATDPGSSRLVYAMVIGLALAGIGFIALAVWILRQTRPDLEVLAPLERMGDGDWRKRDPSTQRRMLDEVRPAGAQPLLSEPPPPPLDADFESDHPVASLSDLGPGVVGDGVDPTPIAVDVDPIVFAVDGDPMEAAVDADPTPPGVDDDPFLEVGSLGGEDDRSVPDDSEHDEAIVDRPVADRPDPHEAPSDEPAADSRPVEGQTDALDGDDDEQDDDADEQDDAEQDDAAEQDTDEQNTDDEVSVERR